MAANKTSSSKRAVKAPAKPAPRSTPAPKAKADAAPKVKVKAQAAVARAAVNKEPAVKSKSKAKAPPAPPPPPEPVVSAFTVGEAVSHKTFGAGKVTEIDGERLTIEFPKIGTKMIIDSFVQTAKKR